MTSTLMIIGAGPLQLPAYSHARAMGLRTVALDRNPEAPGMALADVCYVVDTRDEKGAVQAAIREGIDGVMTLCTDQPNVAVAAVNEALGLSGLRPEVALRATHKGHMREAFRAAGAPVPSFRRVRSFDECRAALDEIGLPAVVKPVLRSGSQGVFRLRRLDMLEEAFRHARAASHGEAELLVEAYVGGPEVSVETVSFAGEHRVIAITDKRTTGDPHHVELGHVEPSRLEAAVQKQIEDVARSGLRALGIMGSAAHVEIKVGEHGPQLIEIGARLGGDYITTELVPRSTGVDMVRVAIELALGHTPDVAPRFKAAAAIRYLSAEPGRIRSLRGLLEARAIPGVVRVEVGVKPGENIREVASSQDRPGFIITEGRSPELAEAAALSAAAMVRIETETMPGHDGGGALET